MGRQDWAGRFPTLERQPAELREGSGYWLTAREKHHASLPALGMQHRERRQLRESWGLRREESYPAAGK
jgi:hypothetical protein